jgi:hypothetical protein
MQEFKGISIPGPSDMCAGVAGGSQAYVWGFQDLLDQASELLVLQATGTTVHRLGWVAFTARLHGQACTVHRSAQVPCPIQGEARHAPLHCMYIRAASIS